MNGKVADAIKQAEQGNVDDLMVIATVANTDLAQQLLRAAIDKHAGESAEWHAEYAGTELNAHQW